MAKRTIDTSRQFRRDLKKLQRSGTPIGGELAQILDLLTSDAHIPANLRDHALTDCAEFMGCRELHIRPNLLLIYEKPDEKTLFLFRLGSHARKRSFSRHHQLLHPYATAILYMPAGVDSRTGSAVAALPGS